MMPETVTEGTAAFKSMKHKDELIVGNKKKK